MNSVLESLKGYKTYIITGATILYCVIGVLLHFMTIPAALAFIGTAGGVAALRGGVGKVQTVLEIVLEVLKVVGEVTPPAPAQPVEPAAPVVAPEVPVAPAQ